MTKKPLSFDSGPVPANCEPTTYAEAVAQERAKWGEAWTSKRDPVPMVCINYRIEVEGRLMPVMLGRGHHRKTLTRRAASKEITRASADRLDAKGDELRDLISGWMKTDRAGRWQETLAKRERLAYLVASGFIARPTSRIVREWLGLAPSASGRGPIDHDTRMRDAEGSFDVVGAGQ